MINRLDKVYSKSKTIKINNKSKFVIMSDCHRGLGNNNDNFLKNKLIYEVALNYYYRKKYTYIELGDGDEMWEVKNYKNIIREYIDIFRLLRRFHLKNRLIMIYGNHDIVKKKESVVKKYFYKYYDKKTKKEENLLNNLIVYESLILKSKDNEIFMLHGHQVDFLNGTIWYIARFLVRYIWRFLESIGITSPIIKARNYKVTNKVEKRLEKWSLRNNKILISGHTHHPIYPKIGNSLYFNDGSCIHSDGITCIEILHGKISLVKWSYKVKKNKLYIKKELLDGNKSIRKFYIKKKRST